MSPSPLRADPPPDAVDGAIAGESALEPLSAGVVLHKLRSPITAIIGFAETLARSAERGTLPPEKLIDRLGRIRDSAVRINVLVDELDQLARRASSTAK